MKLKCRLLNPDANCFIPGNYFQGMDKVFINFNKNNSAIIMNYKYNENSRLGIDGRPFELEVNDDAKIIPMDILSKDIIFNGDVLSVIVSEII